MTAGGDDDEDTPEDDDDECDKCNRDVDYEGAKCFDKTWFPLPCNGFPPRV